MSAHEMKIGDEVVGTIEKLDIQPGDKFVLFTDERLSQGEAQRFGRMWENFTGRTDVKLLILERGEKLTAIKDIENAASSSA